MNIDQELFQTRNRMLTQRQNCKSLFLASQSQDGESEASYSPCLYYQDAFWVFISTLSAHTHNIEREKRAGILIIEPDAEVTNEFARVRQSLQCTAEQVTATSDTGIAVLNAFQAKFGETVAVMRQLADFRLYRFNPIRGRYIEGFGRAFRLSGAGLTELAHIGPKEFKQGAENGDADKN